MTDIHTYRTYTNGDSTYHESKHIEKQLDFLARLMTIALQDPEMEERVVKPVLFGESDNVISFDFYIAEDGAEDTYLVASIRKEHTKEDMIKAVDALFNFRSKE